MTNEPKDLIEGDATEMSDESLETVDAGIGFSGSTGAVSGAGVSPFDVTNSATIYGSNPSDSFGSTQLFGGDAMLRKRPGRVKMTEVDMINLKR